MIGIENPISESQPFGAFRPSNGLVFGLSLLRNAGLARGQLRRLVANWIKRNYEGPWDVEIRKYRARIFLHDNSCELKAYLAGTAYCNQEFKLITERISKKSNPVFIDIGANAGLFTLHANSVTQVGAKILAIEPNPILVSRLEFNISANDADNKCAVFPIAVGANEGEAEFSCTADMGSGSLITTSDEGDNTFKASIIPLVKLLADEEVQRIDILKIDIEGHEDQVMTPFFTSAPESLYPDCVIIENNVNDWSTDCIAQMTALGYQIIFANRANIGLEYIRSNRLATN